MKTRSFYKNCEETSSVNLSQRNGALPYYYKSKCHNANTVTSKNKNNKNENKNENIDLISNNIMSSFIIESDESTIENLNSHKKSPSVSKPSACFKFSPFRTNSKGKYKKTICLKDPFTWKYQTPPRKKFSLANSTDKNSSTLEKTASSANSKSLLTFNTPPEKRQVTDPYQFTPPRSIPDISSTNPLRTPSAQKTSKRIKRVTSEKKSTSSSSPLANVNPFQNCKSSSLLRDDSYSEFEEKASRFHMEFQQLEEIGSGEFGTAFKCIHRLDGCVYAIKRIKRPIMGSYKEQKILREVYAHAVLGVNKHVVRYYSAWKEENFLFIQNEYCNCGSLEKFRSKICSSALNQSFLLSVLRQVASGLRFLHRQGLVHLDIKPENIFVSEIQHNQTKVLYTYSTAQSGDTSTSGSNSNFNIETLIFKIGDLGHATFISDPQMEEEGDCRYLPKELLQESFDHLTKADIFSLALTIYELGRNSPLPPNGPEWHSIREGLLEQLPFCSSSFNNLLKKMVDPIPEKRPPSEFVVQFVSEISSVETEESQKKLLIYKELKSRKVKLRIAQEEKTNGGSNLDQFKKQRSLIFKSSSTAW